MSDIKHALCYNGAPYDADGQLRHIDKRITSGSGRARCACGALSDVLPTGSARRAWFKDHKGTAGAAVSTPEDLLGPVDEPTTKPAPAPEPDPPQDVERVLPFAPVAPVSYWRYLGRDGSRAFVGLLYPSVTVALDNVQRAVVLSGPEPDVQAAYDALGQLWRDAVQAADEWTATDPAYLARPRGGVEGRMAAYHMKGEFLLAYARQQAAELALADA